MNPLDLGYAALLAVLIAGSVALLLVEPPPLNGQASLGAGWRLSRFGSAAG